MYKEDDIIHETNTHWVLRERFKRRDIFTVWRIGLTHSTRAGLFDLRDEGKARAIAHCNKLSGVKMTFHTKRSPSQAKRFLACPGMFALCETLPPEQRNQSSLAAQIGTAAHGLIERCLSEGSNPEDYRGRIIQLVGDEESVSILRAGARTPGADKVFFEVDSDMIDGAEMMTTYVRGRLKTLGTMAVLQLESRTNPLPDRDDTSGTADVTIDAWPDMLEVVDYKNGWNVVEHEDNEQTLAYLLGKALESEFAHESYRVTIVQPNAGHEAGRIRSFNATKESLLEFQTRYRSGIHTCQAAEEAFSKIDESRIDGWGKSWLKSGSHCMFCPAQAVCPARRQFAQVEAKMDFAEEPRDLAPLDRGEDVARILKWAPTLNALIKAAELWALRALEAGRKVPGVKLVRGKSNRKLKDISAAELERQLLLGAFIGKAADLYTEPELKSGPQIEKLVPSKRRKEFSERFLFKPEGRLTVAPDSDPRPAITFSVADDFEDDIDPTASGNEEEFG